MKKLVTLLLLLLASPVWGATYYVNSASSGGDGTTTATSGATAAFATLAAAMTALSGNQSDNSLLLNRGNTWNEMLVMTAYGTAGHPFTVGAYGTGALPIVNAGTEDYPVLLNNIDYTIIEYLDVRGGDTLGGIILYGGADNNIVRYCSVTDSVNASNAGGIIAYQSNNNTITHNTITGCSQGISVVGGGSGATGNTVSHNIITTSVDSGISVNTGAASTIVEYNTAYGNKGTEDRVGMGAFNAGTGNIFRYNKAYNNGDSTHKYCGFWVDGDGTVNNIVQFYYNVAYNNTGGGFAASGNVAHKFYNNVGYKNSDASHDYGELNFFIVGELAPANIYAVNNIFVAESDKTLFSIVAGGESGGHVLNTNLWYGGSASPFVIGSLGALNWAAYNAIVAGDITGNPLFTSATNFHLTSQSPAINAGTPVGLTRDFLGTHVPLGAGVDIGAYEYGRNAHGVSVSGGAIN